MSRVRIAVQERTVKSVSAEFGYKCINLVKQSDGIEEYLNRDIEDDIYGIYYRYKKWDMDEFNRDNKYDNYQRDFGVNQKCKKLATLYVGLIKSNEFKDKLILIDTLKKLKSNTTSKIKKAETQYGNMLLEKIAKQSPSKSILQNSSDNVKNNLNLLRDKLSQTYQHLEVVEDITTLKEFQKFINYLEENKKDIQTQYREKLSQYQLEKMIAIYMFLIPLFLISYFMYRRLKVKGWQISSYLMLHISNVAGLYILFFLMERIYQIIPKVLLAKIIIFLTQYDLQVLINLFVLIIFSLIFGFIIKKIQNNSKKDGNLEYIKEEKRKESFAKGGCLNCNSKIDLDEKYCSYCGEENYISCKSCKEKIRNGTIYCSCCKQMQ